MDVQIPATIAQAKKALNGVGQLLTAKQWERAAIVYAFTEQGTNQYAQTSSSRLTIADFSRLNLVGLRRPQTIGVYRKAWQDAIDDGLAVSVNPGDTVTLPTREFPDNPLSPKGTMSSIKAAIRKDPKVLTEVIGSTLADLRTDERIAELDPVVEDIAEVLAADPGVAARIPQMVEEKAARNAVAAGITPQPKAPGEDWDKVVRAVMSNHTRADIAIRDLLRDLPVDSIYKSSLKDMLQHLLDDEKQIAKWRDHVTALMLDVNPETGAIIKNVTPVKELA